MSNSHNSFNGSAETEPEKRSDESESERRSSLLHLTVDDVSTLSSIGLARARKVEALQIEQMNKNRFFFVGFFLPSFLEVFSLS